MLATAEPGFQNKTETLKDALGRDLCMGSTLAPLPLKQTGCKNIKRSLGQSVQ